MFFCRRLLVRADLVELKETQGLNQNSYLKGKYGFMKNILVIKVLPKRYQFNGRPSMGVDLSWRRCRTRLYSLTGVILMDKAYTRLPDKENCYGCFACVNRCSANAIRMIPDHEGFLYPCVDDKKCTNCGECLRVCPSLCKTSTKKRSKSIVASARKYSERVYSKSSSGGIFPILAKKVLSNKGIVVGAAFNNRWDVEHISIEDAVELSKLRGSKYVQSRIGDMYSYVKKMLVDNRTVLFVGTPCQVAGLKAFLEFDYNNLITVDLICKGVPSPLVWNKYLDELYDRRSIVDINFRDKIYGWPPPLTISFTLKNGKTIRKNSKSEPYMRAFRKSLSLRPSCYRCKYKSMNRVSDISLGDFWGVGKCWGIVNDEKGISLVLVNTNKGYGLYKSIRSELKVNKRISHRKSVIKNKALTTGLECSFPPSLTANFSQSLSGGGWFPLPPVSLNKLILQNYSDHPIIDKILSAGKSI